MPTASTGPEHSGEREADLDRSPDPGPSEAEPVATSHDPDHLAAVVLVRDVDLAGMGAEDAQDLSALREGAPDERGP
jgi:hypothetical protein